MYGLRKWGGWLAVARLLLTTLHNYCNLLATWSQTVSHPYREVVTAAGTLSDFCSHACTVLPHSQLLLPMQSSESVVSFPAFISHTIYGVRSASSCNISSPCTYSIRKHKIILTQISFTCGTVSFWCVNWWWKSNEWRKEWTNIDYRSGRDPNIE